MRNTYRKYWVLAVFVLTLTVAGFVHADEASLQSVKTPWVKITTSKVKKRFASFKGTARHAGGIRQIGYCVNARGCSAASLMIAEGKNHWRFRVPMKGFGNDRIATVYVYAQAEDGTWSKGTKGVALDPLKDKNLQLFYTPTTPGKDGHEVIINAISKAKSSVRMAMFMLEDQNVINALENANSSTTSNVAVQVLLNPSGDNVQGYQDLWGAGVFVLKSSTAFALTHEKAMVVDNKTAYITSMNMSNEAAFSLDRDLGVSTEDPSVIAEWNSVFSADVINALKETRYTPKLSVPSLVWSPVNSELKLTALIDSANSAIIATTETLKNRRIVEALEQAVRRQVSVRLITPQCAKVADPTYDYHALYELLAAGVSARVMPYTSATPPTHKTPYMHQKMILVDNTVAYVGSVNFSHNSTHNDREAGIIFENEAATQQIGELFETDWSHTIEVPATPPTNCPAFD